MIPGSETWPFFPSRPQTLVNGAGYYVNVVSGHLVVAARTTTTAAAPMGLYEYNIRQARDCGQIVSAEGRTTGFGGQFPHEASV